MAKLQVGDIVRVTREQVLSWRECVGNDVGIVEKVGDYNPTNYGPFIWVQFPLLTGSWVFHHKSLEKVGHVDG